MLNEVRKDPQRRISAINSVVESIAHIPDQVARDVYVQECSEILDIPEATIAKSVAKVRAALVERFKQERLRKEYSGSASTPAGSALTPPSGGPTVSGSSAAGFQAASAAPAPVAAPAAGPQQALDATQAPAQVDYIQNPLYPFERSVIKYCLRYGFLTMCSYEANPDDPDSPIISLDVLDYVKEELADSDMTFSIEIFSRMFHLLHALRPDFQRHLEQCTKDIDFKCDRMRQDGYNKIAESGTSTAEIKREEAKLEEKISAMREEALHEVAKDYPGRVLGSHEDADIRQLVLELMFDKHHLSNIYLKDPSNEREEDRLNVLLVRAFNEWKEGLINLRIRDLVKQLQAIAGKGDTAEEQRLQLELKSLLSIRSDIAKYIGDRIITKT